MSSPSAKLSNDILVTSLFKVALKIRGLVLIPLLTTSLSVSDYGAYMQVMAITTLLGTISLIGTDGGIIKYINSTDTPKRLFTSLILLTLVISIGVGAIVAMNAELLSVLTLRSDAYTVLFIVGATYIPLTVVYQLGRSRYRAQRQVKFYSMFEAVDVYLTVGGLVVAVLVYETSIAGAFIATVVARLIATMVVYFGLFRAKEFGWPTTNGIYECLIFSFGTMIQRLSQTIITRTDRILLGAFIGANAVGVYSAAYSVSYLMLLYFRPLSISFYPEFSKLWINDKYIKIRKYTVNGLRYLVGLSLPSIAGFALIGPSVLNLLSTNEVAQAGAIPLILLASAMLCKGVQEIYTQLFYASGDSRTPALVQGIGAVVNVLLNLALIPLYNVAGAAAASVLSFGLAMGGTFWLFQRQLETGVPWLHFARIVIATAIMYGIFTIIPLHWLLTVAIAPLIYAAVLVGIGGIERSELTNIVGIVR